jgi:hypothetical protein
VIETLVMEVTRGAVKSPFAEIVPALALQLTPLLLALWTLAVNCWVSFEARVAVFGETEMLIAAGAAELLPAESPHDAVRPVSNKREVIRMKLWLDGAV